MSIARIISGKNISRIGAIGILSGFLYLMASCSQEDIVQDRDPQFQQTDQPGSPSIRLHAENKTLPYRRIKSGTGTTDEVTFVLKYMLDGPTVDGAPIQASHITNHGDNWYIAYNTAGPAVAGGIDRLAMNGSGTPELSAVATSQSEYSSVEVLTDYATGKSQLVLAGVGSTPESDPLPQLQFFTLDDEGIPELNPVTRTLNGFVATDINALGVVTGTQGGLYEISSPSDTDVHYITDLDDARSIAWNPDTREFAALLGNPGRLITGLPDNKIVVSLGGLSRTETKAILRIHNGFAIAALGEEGLKVVSLASGTVTGSLPRPDISDGSNPDDYVTNGVSINTSGRVFIANGAAGVFVAQLGSDGTIDLLGSINLDASVNFVEAQGDLLYAACGAKGVAIIGISGLPAGLPEFSTVRVGEISGETAAVQATIRNDGGQPVLSRGFCWSPLSIPTLDDTKSLSGNGSGDFTGTIYGLVANTKYYIRAFATNSAGTGYSETFTLTTPDVNGEFNTFTDTRDGHIYKYVKLGSQVWMAENLAFLPKVDRASSGSATAPYYYVYDYHGQDVDYAKQTGNYNQYGVLYNWPAAVSACPPGWHLPSDAEWKQLEQYLGMTTTDAEGVNFRYTGEVGKSLKAQSGWNNNGNGVSDGFNALPGGIRIKGGTFEDIGDFAGFWTSDGSDLHRGTYRGLFNFNAGIYRNYWFYSGGFSVRCIRD
ncbi:MAG: hypothetical protein A2X22_08160 [Bacteroidetes bacterium GWF2_49_14]|nr:MAG: hypothetical protein A2X22_08160 [Bacteroidetes bacterium GWF2_49_14]HBB91785.1 hypothetical protein [Bacteroidales bacterium]